jgi:hypothetical protein
MGGLQGDVDEPVCARQTKRRETPHLLNSGSDPEAISSEHNARHNPRAKGWFDKVKEFFEG